MVYDYNGLFPKPSKLAELNPELLRYDNCSLLSDDQGRGVGILMGVFTSMK